MNTTVLALFQVLLLLVVVFPAMAQRTRSKSTAKAPPAQIIERGTFLFYDFKQLRGHENYEIRRDRDRLRVTTKINLPSMGEEEKPALSSELLARPDLTLESFKIKGIRPLGIAIDTSIEIEGGSAKIR